MTSPDDDDPVRSKLEYAPPWVREQAVRDQAAREQAARDDAQAGRERPPREPITRDQFRAALRQSAGASAAQLTPIEPESREDRPWRQRALEPELVPAPPAAASNLWPIMLRMGVVCAMAAMVAAVVVFLFSPKQLAHKIAQASAPAPASVVEDAASSIESSRGVPALSIETSAGAATPPAQDQVAIATPPQIPQQQVAAATPPAEPAAPAKQIASLPAPNASPADTRPSAAPAVNEPAPRPVDANPGAVDPKPAAIPAPVPAPVQATPAPIAKPAVMLDENEITTLIRRGKNLLNDGDFAAARVLFERAANAGSAEAALALGSTYDPNVIKRLGAIMVKPDIESARKWYQLAADRGSAAASLQLANLPQSR